MDLAGAVAADDQVGSFVADAFTQGLAGSLAQGRFRLVLVLDDAPEELVRLIGYLEAVTADRLLIDLVTVSSYRIGDSEVIVPQRVEAERRLAEPRPTTPVPSEAAGRLVDGVEDFDASIGAVREEQRPALQRLRDWAVALHREGLVGLKTYHTKHPNRLSLLPRFPDENVGLVTIYNNNGNAALQVWARVFERRAPAGLPVVEGIIAPASLGHGTYVPAISDELLAALTGAYRAAAGRERPAGLPPKG